MRTARRAGTNAAAIADDCRNGCDGHKRHGVDVRAIHVHAADPDVRRSGRRAQREHDQDREDETDAGRHADQPRHPSVDAHNEGLVDQNIASWNRVVHWMRQLETLRLAS
jgi:hypothetical protein